MEKEQEQTIKVMLHYKKDVVEDLVRGGLELKGFDFVSNQEFSDFVAEHCRLVYTKSLHMYFFCDHDLFKGSFLFVENWNKPSYAGATFRSEGDYKINYNFL